MGGVGVRGDSDGIAVVRWWRERCIEWCHDVVDGIALPTRLSRFISAAVSRVASIENIGANLAPWNIGNYRIDFRGTGC